MLQKMKSNNQVIKSTFAGKYKKNPRDRKNVFSGSKAKKKGNKNIKHSSTTRITEN